MHRPNHYAFRSSRMPNSRPRRQKRTAGGVYIDPAKFIKQADASTSAAYKSQHEFADFAMHPLLKANVTAKGYTTPSEIQDKTITLGLDGKNVVGIANTGTGKTAAFSLPVLNSLMRTPGSQALIIAPTRELAIQIEEQCRILSHNSNLRSALLIGGMPMGRQLRDLRANSRLIIGTPGRIKDHLSQGSLSLSRCNMIVLDEVDRMLDMGFINDVRLILSKLPAERQSFFFSATLSPTIQSLIQTFAPNPVVINVKVSDTSANVNQDVIRYSGKTQKLESLHDVLIRPTVSKTLIFGKTKYGVERLGKDLKVRGFKVEALHGGKSQGARKRALNAFRDNQVNVLVATDVAARGIDVKDISHVINYDTPQTYEDYIHRIGRAGRAGQPGNALTFVEH